MMNSLKGRIYTYSVVTKRNKKLDNCSGLSQDILNLTLKGLHQYI